MESLITRCSSPSIYSPTGEITAAVISPVGEYIDGDEHLVINDSKIGPVAQFLYDELTGIQWGKREDPYGWRILVK